MAGAALFAALLALPRGAYAQAGEDEVFVTLAAEYAAAPDFRASNRGVGGSVGAFWGFSRWFSLGARAGAHHLFPIAGSSDEARSADVLSAFVGPGFAVDILEVVPSITLMPGVFAGDGTFGDSGLDFGMRASLGIDYRPSRVWALGAEVAWHAVFTESTRFPGYSVFAIRVSRVFDLRGL